MPKSSRSVLFTFVIIAIMFISACAPKGPTSSDTNEPNNNVISDSKSTQTSVNQGKSNPADIPVDNFPRTPDPLSVMVTLDKAHTVKKTSFGFQLSLNGKTADESEISLSLDPKLYNMDADENLTNNFAAEVSMTPISAIDGLPFSGGFLTAVQLGPDGLVMAEPAKLTLVAPGKFDNSELIGFSADGDGSNFHMYPVTAIYQDYDNTTRFYFNIMHFSLYGVARATLAEIEGQQAHPPTNSVSQDEDELAPLVIIKPDTSELTPLIGKIQLQLLKSHTRLVKPYIDSLASTKCERVSVAAYRFNEWQSKVDHAFQMDYFQQQISSDANALHARFNECAKTLCPVCIGSQSGNKADLAKMNSMITLATFAEALSFQQGFDDFGYWRALGNKCAQSAGVPGAGGSTGGETSGDATLPTPTPLACPVN